jgi:trans-aconitate 2-methyltransferase
VTDWSCEDYAKISSLQRAMIREAKASLVLADSDRVLDVGCGDGYLTHEMAGMVPGGFAIGVDPSKRMITTAHAAAQPTKSGQWFVIADARRGRSASTSTSSCRSMRCTGCPNRSRR